jgi:hypothetical protein
MSDVSRCTYDWFRWMRLVHVLRVDIQAMFVFGKMRSMSFRCVSRTLTLAFSTAKFPHTCRVERHGQHAALQYDDSRVRLQRREVCVTLPLVALPLVNFAVLHELHWRMNARRILSY